MRIHDLVEYIIYGYIPIIYIYIYLGKDLPLKYSLTCLCVDLYAEVVLGDGVHPVDRWIDVIRPLGFYVPTKGVGRLGPGMYRTGPVHLRIASPRRSPSWTAH